MGTAPERFVMSFISTDWSISAKIEELAWAYGLKIDDLFIGTPSDNSGEHGHKTIMSMKLSHGEI